MRYVKEKFAEYYKNPDIAVPPDPCHREYGFLFFDSRMMKRHMAFPQTEDLIDFLGKNVPAHTYYSSAYYDTPDASSMNQKGWRGADLIFDLDADHLPGAVNLSYEDMLVNVKVELRKLVSFLIDDFGFTQKDIKLFFSGGRGYHCHVIHPRVQELGSHERREIVDYITGKGLLTDKIFKERVYDKQGPQGQYKRTRLEIPKPTEGGWNGRIARSIIRISEEIKEMEEENAIAYLMGFAGITRKSAIQFLRDLTPDKIARIKEGILDQSTSIKKIFMKGALRLSAMHAAGTDEPVTADIKRLIRLPGSLHGKTGLKVQSLSIDELEEFNPLSDAVVFGDDEIQVVVKKKVDITMKGHHYVLTEGKEKVPEYLAVFLIARGLASYP